MTPMAQISLSLSQSYVCAWCRTCLHWFAVSCLTEDLGRHVAWRSAGRCENVELLLIHDSRKTKVGNQQIGIVFGCSEE